MKKTTKLVLMSVLTIALCVSLIMGATFALFTSESSTNIVVSSGRINVTATIDPDLELYSLQDGEENVLQTGKFATGGTATIEGDNLQIANIVPGDSVKLTINITNNSTVNVKYRVTVTNEGDYTLYRKLSKTVETDGIELGKWAILTPADTTAAIVVTIGLPLGAGIEYQGLETKLTFAVEATQGNAEVVEDEPSFDITDDANTNGEALANALNEAVSGDTIYIPYAEYDLSAQNNISADDVTIVGLPDVLGNNPTITSAVDITGNNVTIQNLDIAAEGSTGEGNYVVTVSGENFTMDGCNVSRTTGATPAYGMVIAISAPGDATITNSTFVAPVAGSTNDIANASPSVIEANGNLIMSDCIIATNGYGLFAQHVTNATLTNVTFCGLDRYYDGSDVTVTSLYMAINSTCIENIVLDGCTIKDARSYGILAGGKSLTINNTVFTNISGTHIYFGWASEAMDEVVLTNNTFDLSTGYGPRFSTYGCSSIDNDTKINIDGNKFVDLAKNSDHDNRLIMNDCERTIEATNCEITNCPDEYQNNKNVIVNKVLAISVSTSEQLINTIATLNQQKPEYATIINLAEGTYVATANEQFRLTTDNVTIIGAGEDKTIIDVGEYACSGQAGILIAGDNCAVANLTIKSSRTDGTVSVLKVTDVDAGDTVKGFTLSNVTLNGEAGHGLNLHGVDTVTIDNLTVTHFSKCAIALAKATDVVINSATTAAGGWAAIGFMYDSKPGYETASSVTVNFANCTFGANASGIITIYSERTADGQDAINYQDAQTDGWNYNDSGSAWSLTK